MDSWDERPHTVQELEAILHSRKEAAFMRDTSMSSSFSQQVLEPFELMHKNLNLCLKF